MEEEKNINKCCQRGIYIVIATIIFSACFLATGFIVANTFYKVKALNNVIAVTGSADKTVKSDLAKWTSNFSRTVLPENLKDGSNQMKNDLTLILQTFKDRGVKDSEITVQTMNITPVCVNSNNASYDQFGKMNCGANNISSYTLQQSILIQSSDVDNITKLSQEAAGYFIDQGLIFSSQSLEYYYSKLADLRMELINEATANAQARAQQIAESTGSKIGNLQSANLGVFQVTAANSTEVSDYGVYDTTTIDKKITGVIKASFTLTQ